MHSNGYVPHTIPKQQITNTKRHQINCGNESKLQVAENIE